jgi:hypothetical protein
METLQPPDRASARIIEAYGAFLEAPASKLKFVRRAVARCQVLEERAPSSWPLFDRFNLYRIVAEELLPLLPAEAPVPASVRIALWVYKIRVVLYAGALALTVAGTSAAVYAGAKAIVSIREATTAAAERATDLDRSAQPTTSVPDVPGYAPGQIWLVESGDEFELYSNGARILTEFQTEGPARKFFAFPRGIATPEEAIEHAGAPIGIVFHTSQSHIAPFSPEYNEKLRTSSRALLQYVREHRLYNYVIDRFGRIYRLVPDEAASDHAGNSVWADESAVYVDISDSFVGVCFEASWSSDSKIAPDQLNEAQIYAGRALTAMLRSRYSIADVNCVTHALVSVSPVSKLVGFHMDWGTGFPFEALNLSNKYDVTIPSIVEFGFDHDSALERSLGGRPWPGIVDADSTLNAIAQARGVTVAAVRSELQKRYSSYRSWLKRHGGRPGEGK